jgi:hypothetical protein
MKIIIINVGVNSTHGNLMSPICSDGTFKFVPITSHDRQALKTIKTYRELFHDDYSSIPEKKRNWKPHNDPEFETFTFGDYPDTKPNLRKLEPGDLLFFLARLVEYENKSFNEDKCGFYLVGYFQIESILKNVNKKPSESELRIYGQNAHIVEALEKPEWFDGFWVFKGSKKSMLFEKAIPFTKELLLKTITNDGKELKWNNCRNENENIGSFTRPVRIVSDNDYFLKYIREHTQIKL